MTGTDGLDRRLTAWLEEEAAPHAPAGLQARFIEDMASSRQRPGWATTERWISMETRAQLGAVPRAAIILVTLGILTALAAGAIVAGSSSTSSVPAPFGTAANGLIAFSSNGDIHVAEPDGSGARAITTGPAYDYSPYWSRDGMRLAFWSEPPDGSPPLLLVVGPDGEDAVTVAESPSPTVGLFMTWSEDSSEIIYGVVVPELATDPCPVPESSGGMCGSRIFVAPIDGSGARQIGDPELDARNPELSPDGRTLAFGGGLAGSEGLYRMDRDGSDVRRLTSEAVPSGGWGFIGQAWAADGARIVTQGGNRMALPDIWVVEADGSGETNISNDPADETWARSAPSGDAVSWSRGGRTMLWTPDAGEPVELPAISNVAWSPDGELLAGANLFGRLVVVDREGNIRAEVVAPDLGLVISWQRLAP